MRLVIIDEATLPLRNGCATHFEQDIFECHSIGFDRARERIAPESAKTHDFAFAPLHHLVWAVAPSSTMTHVPLRWTTGRGLAK